MVCILNNKMYLKMDIILVVFNDNLGITTTNHYDELIILHILQITGTNYVYA
jgi:hypothetical protein